jgi:Domain of unknown function (DUF4406)
MKFYLAGPQAGLPENNALSFTEAKTELQRLGHEVIVTPEREGYCDFEGLLKCDAVVVLPAWGRSIATRAEVLVAILTDKRIYAFHQHRPEKLEELPDINIVTRAEMLK